VNQTPVGGKSVSGAEARQHDILKTTA